MKTVLTAVFLLGIFSIPGFAQVDLPFDNHQLSDSLTVKPLEYHMQPLTLKPDQKSNKLLDLEKSFKAPELPLPEDYALLNIPSITEEPIVVYDMPCLIPNQNSSMPVSVPDTTLQYSILIKEL